MADKINHRCVDMIEGPYENLDSVALLRMIEIFKVPYYKLNDNHKIITTHLIFHDLDFVPINPNIPISFNVRIYRSNKHNEFARLDPNITPFIST